MTSISRILAVVLVLAPAAAYGLVDPMRPPWIDPAAGRDPAHGVLRAILIDGDRRLALIGGHWLGVGGRSGRRRVVTVGHRQVVVMGTNGRQTLHLGGVGGRSGITKTIRLSAGVRP